MYKYKVTLPNKSIVEFESEQHISSIRAKVTKDGSSPIVFKDAEMVLNLSSGLDIEIDGEPYRY